MTKIFGRSIHQRVLINKEIPLSRYFLLVGGALLALLFAADAIAPRQPAIESDNSGPSLPRIRIHSEQKGPKAVFIDTSQPTIMSPTAQEEAAQIIVPPAPQLAENAAQVASRSQNRNNANELSKAVRKPQAHSKIARARAKRPQLSYAQHPDFGAFDGHWTFDQQQASIGESFGQFTRQQRQSSAWREPRTEHPPRPHVGWFDTGW